MNIKSVDKEIETLERLAKERMEDLNEARKCLAGLQIQLGSLSQKVDNLERAIGAIEDGASGGDGDTLS